MKRSANTLATLVKNNGGRARWVAPSLPDPSGVAREFGQRFESEFDAKVVLLRRGKHGEIALFRAMHQSLEVAANTAVRVGVHEYHGAGHQVHFEREVNRGGGPARCELSDLAVIAFSTVSGEARLVYIQAKFEKAWPKQNPSTLKANGNQWDLLAHRPEVHGAGNFDPPRDLLSSSPMTSIGSFVFFVGMNGGADLQFAAASRLCLMREDKAYRGRVMLPLHRDWYVTKPVLEVLSAVGSSAFASALADLRIGAPLDRLPDSVRTWVLDRVLAAAILRGADPQFVSLARDLLVDRLDPLGAFDQVAESAASGRGRRDGGGIGGSRLMLIGVGELGGGAEREVTNAAPLTAR